MVRLVLALVMLAWLAAAAQAQDVQQEKLDRWNAALERIDSAIVRVDVNDISLRDLRREVATIVDAANEFAASLTQRVNAAEAQVKELSPAAGSTTALPESVTEDLEAAQKLYGDLLGSQKQALAIAAHGASTTAQINERRRRMFTARLLERNASLFDPSLWVDAAREVPVLAGRSADLFGEWGNAWQDRKDRSAIAAVLMVVAAMLVAIIPGRRLLLGSLSRREKRRPSIGRSKVIAAAVVLAVNTFVPAAVLGSGHAILSALNLAPDRVSQFWFGVTSGVVVFSLGFGVARALLAPTRPDLRLVSLDDAIVRRIFAFAVSISVLQGLAVFIDRFTKIASTSLPLVIAIDGVLTVSTAVLIILAVRTLNRRPDADEEDDEDAAEEPLIRRVALIVAGLTAAIAVVACLIGYVALGRFMVTQTVWATIIVSVCVLLIMLADEMTAAWFRREGVVGSRLMSSVGFAPRSLTQMGVLFNGLVRVLLVGLAILAMVAPWGIDSSSVFESVRQLFFGFRIGSITISLSTIVAAIFVFCIGLFATRALQGWLETRFLPTTRLDSGLRNSIRTTVGHVGWIAAAAIAFGYAGLDLSNIAIVAGALSVGIGLGLQAIVNNFVSGLILLAERPIRAGDWISVGADEGIVKRINVRATELETFDRATVIIPNSSLITGVVKNMVLRDRSGRAVVKIVVSKHADPAKVRDILLAIAKQNPIVLSFPEPAVLFTDFDATSLYFELYCYLSDNGKGGSVRSDVRFQAFAEFAKHGIELPHAFPGDVAPSPQIGEHSAQANP